MARACKKYAFLFTAVLVLVVGTGCVTHQAPVVPPVGWLFTQYSAPMDIDYGRAEQVTTPVTQLRSGRSETQYVLIPIGGPLSFGWGDASVDSAVRNGGFNRLHHADYEYMSILGLYQTFTTVAYGE